MDDPLFTSDKDDPPKAPDHVDSAPPPKTDDEEAFSHLVGEGKKFRDQEALARAKMESDNFILRLQNENAGLRQDLNTRLTLEEFMEKVKPQEPSSSSVGEPPPDERDGQKNTSQSLSADDIAKLVAEQLNQSTEKTKQQTNVEHVIGKAKEVFGPQYKSELTKRADALGMDQKELSSMAATQPKVFLKLMVDDAVKDPGYIPPPSSSVSDSFGGEVRNKPFSRQSQFSAVRTSDPKKYWSVEFQNLMHQTAQKEGEAFFDV